MGCAPSTAKRRIPVNYNSVDSLWKGLESKDVLMVKGSWLMEHATNGNVLASRQECPSNAFMSLRELKDIHANSEAKPMGSTYKRAPLIAISHSWRAKNHPDRDGITLRIVGGKLEDQRVIYNEHGMTDVGVFFDWASLYQDPRREHELHSFRRSLELISLWYAHALTTVYLVTDTPEGLVTYRDRGWTSFELNLSWMLKPADKYNVWPQVSDVGEGSSRPVPAEPDAFKEGHIFGDKIFTDAADRDTVATKFRETCEDVYGSVTKLNFDLSCWGDAEIDGLAPALPLMQSLKDMYLSGNQFTRLPNNIGQLQALQMLVVERCTSLISLPEGICQVQALQKLILRDCTSLRSLPEDIGQLKLLENLNLQGCSSLSNLPESIGQLQSLQKLDLRYCTSLVSLPESIRQLRELKRLKLIDGTVVSLPESSGQLQALQKLALQRSTLRGEVEI